MTQTGHSGLSAILERIRSAEQAAGRPAGCVRLVAVSKTFDVADILPVIGSGQRMFGENRVQEAGRKWPQLRHDVPDIELHLIGPLQTNKAREAVNLFDVIETVDRPRLARELAKVWSGDQRCKSLFVQVNTGAEPQKAGVLPEETDALVRLSRDELGMPVEGLMCIPPVDEEPALHFALLAKLARRNGLEKLSMGMSADFETAIEFGASHVRVGSAIFGGRTAAA